MVKLSSEIVVDKGGIEGNGVLSLGRSLMVSTRSAKAWSTSATTASVTTKDLFGWFRSRNAPLGVTVGTRIVHLVVGFHDAPK